MRQYDLNEAAEDLYAQSNVIELHTWTDSISIRYTGPFHQLNFSVHKHDLFIQNVEGVVYFSPGPGYSLNENVGGTPCSSSEFEEFDGVDDVGMIEECGRKRMLVSTPGVADFKSFQNCGTGWALDHIKEAQIRITPQNASASYILDRHTHQIASMTSSKTDL